MMSLDKYRQMILSEFYKREKLLEALDNENFEYLFEEIHPVFFFELIHLFKSSNIQVPKKYLNIYESIKQDLRLYETAYVHNSSYSFEFGYVAEADYENITQIGPVIRFIHLLVEDKLDIEELDSVENIVKDLIKSYLTSSLELSLTFKAYKPRKILQGKPLENYPNITLQLADDLDVVIASVEWNYIQVKKAIYTDYDEASKIFKANEDAVIATFNKLINRLNKI